MDGDGHRDQGVRRPRDRTRHEPPAPPPRGSGRRVWGLRVVLLGPGVAWWLVFFLVPVGVLIAYSFFRRGPTAG